MDLLVKRKHVGVLGGFRHPCGIWINLLAQPCHAAMAVLGADVSFMGFFAVQEDGGLGRGVAKVEPPIGLIDSAVVALPGVCVRQEHPELGAAAGKHFIAYGKDAAHRRLMAAPQRHPDKLGNLGIFQTVR